MILPRIKAEWEPYMHLGLIFTRDAFNNVRSPKATKRVFHFAVRFYIEQLKLLPEATTQPCVCCHEPADRWHHPSYDKGFHIVVQPVCKACHDGLYSEAKQNFYNSPLEQWSLWRSDERAHLVDAAYEEIRNRINAEREALYASDEAV